MDKQPDFDPAKSQEWRADEALRIASQSIQTIDRLGTHTQKHGFAVIFLVILILLVGYMGFQIVEMMKAYVDEEKNVHRVLSQTHQDFLKRFESLERTFGQIDVRLADLQEKNRHSADVIALTKNAIISERIEELLKNSWQVGIKKVWFARMHNGTSDYANRPFVFFSVAHEIVFDGEPTRDKNQRVLVELLGDQWPVLLKRGLAVFKLSDVQLNAWAGKNMKTGRTQKIMIYPVLGGKNGSIIVGMVAFESALEVDHWLLKVSLSRLSLNIGGVIGMTE